MAELTDAFWDIGGGHHLAWGGDLWGEDDPAAGNLYWVHPDHEKCRGWHGIDVTSGKHHSITDGGRGDEQNLTVVASVLCPQSGEHGYITRGKWVPA